MAGSITGRRWVITERAAYMGGWLTVLAREATSRSLYAQLRWAKVIGDHGLSLTFGSHQVHFRASRGKDLCVDMPKLIPHAMTEDPNQRRPIAEGADDGITMARRL